jgi:hypothetical protein
MPMRRLIIAVLLSACATLAIVGCGSSAGPGSSAPNPAVQALSYFPPTTPFVLTAATAPQSQGVRQAQALERRIPNYAIAATALFAELSKLGIDYNQDIRPLFGNPIAVGAIGTQGLTGSQAPPFLVVWVTKSATKLTALLGKLRGLRSTGTHDGAKLYAGGGAAAAAAGSTLIFSRSTSDLEAALDRHARNQGFSSADYARATTGIAQNGAVEIFGELANVLAAPSAAQAGQVPWVAAIRGYGVSIGSSPAGVTIKYHLDTTGRALSASELPIASGSTAPKPGGDLPVQAAIRDPAQIIDFILATLRQTDPAGYARFLAKEATLKRRAGIDIGSLASRFSGDMNVESDTRTTIARAQVSDPSSVAQTLVKLTKAGTSGNGSTPPALRRLGGGLYSITSSKPTVTVGVIGDQLVVGRATAAQLHAFAATPSATTSSGTGSVTFRIALAQLLQITLKKVPSPLAQQVLSRLGDLTGSAGATTSGLTGTATLAIR